MDRTILVGCPLLGRGCVEGMCPLPIESGLELNFVCVHSEKDISVQLIKCGISTCDHIIVVICCYFFYGEGKLSVFNDVLHKSKYGYRHLVINSELEFFL